MFRTQLGNSEVFDSSAEVMGSLLEEVMSELFWGELVQINWSKGKTFQAE